jgi:hypothetical protein
VHLWAVIEKSFEQLRQDGKLAVPATSEEGVQAAEITQNVEEPESREY